MEEITLKAYAKINLGLDIVGKREDGYHLLKSVMQQVDLYDVICVKKISNGIILKSESPYVPLDETNIAYKCAKLMMDIYGFIYLIRCLSVEVNNRKAVILGSGGTSKMACFALSLLGASEIVVVSRSSRSYETKVSCPVSFVSYEEVEKFRDADLLVNTTPVGMYPYIIFQEHHHP